MGTPAIGNPRDMGTPRYGDPAKWGPPRNSRCGDVIKCNVRIARAERHGLGTGSRLVWFPDPSYMDRARKGRELPFSPRPYRKGLGTDLDLLSHASHTSLGRVYRSGN